MAVPQKIAGFWNAYASAAGGVDEGRFFDAFYFGDSQELADSLAALVLSGVKHATTSSVWSFEAEGRRLPAAGDLSVVTNWAGTPLCVIETQSVEVVSFNQVSADFAAGEGEGDGSLASWREGHEKYFRRECAGAGRQFAEDMLVVCERFRVVWRAVES